LVQGKIIYFVACNIFVDVEKLVDEFVGLAAVMKEVGMQSGFLRFTAIAVAGCLNFS
jgi:hypothetical protein